MRRHDPCAEAQTESGHIGDYTWAEYDARGIYLCKVCDKCRDVKLAGYRSDVLTDPNYWHDEPIEPDEW